MRQRFAGYERDAGTGLDYAQARYCAPSAGRFTSIGDGWKYLYRAVGPARDATEFMLPAKRDVPAAKRFFKKLMGADHRRLPFTVGAEKHASYPEAFAVAVKEKVLPFDCKQRCT